MKKLFIILLLIVPAAASAQQKCFMSLYNKYSGQSGYTSMEITKTMIQMLKMSGGAEGENGNALDGINRIMVLACSNGPDDSMVSEVKKMPWNNYYNMIMNINSDGTNTRFFIDKKDSIDKISEFLMIVQDEDSSVLINICGNMDINNISSITDMDFLNLDL